MSFELENLNKSPWLINCICPYFTMFPIQYPVKILNTIDENAIVFDPFIGRGTSLLAARMFGFEAYGIDNNPVATAVSKAKLVKINVENIMETLEKGLNYNGEYEVPKSEFWQLAYAKDVLEEICKLRFFLLNSDGISETALRALILGALHGPKSSKVENGSYFSNQMPRTYSTKPAYSVKYWTKNNMQPDRFDIRKIIRKRAERYYNVNIPSIKSAVIQGDSRNITNYNNFPLVNIIITSPPYYGMRTYYVDQWIRNWFLGGPEIPKNCLNDQISHSSPEEFSANLGTVWSNCADISTENAKMFVRFGSIPSRKADAMKIFKQSIELSNNKWEIISISDAGSSLLGKRQADQMLAFKNSSPISEFDVELKKYA